MNDRDGGLYLLILGLKRGRTLKAGRLPKTYFKPGLYLYVGRAKHGLRKRLERHRRKEKKLFWHIDYFLRATRIEGIWVKLNSFDECRTVSQIREILKRSEVSQERFGASDCQCPGHLLYLPEARDLEELRKRLAFENLEVQ
ncbi:MAG: GIY-YIG nuclease family protein [Candidatus Aminicenantales bacterium]